MNELYFQGDQDIYTRHGVSVRINPDGTVDIFGAKSMNFASESMNFEAKNIRMEADVHMVLKSKRIDLNPSEDQ